MFGTIINLREHLRRRKKENQADETKSMEGEEGGGGGIITLKEYKSLKMPFSVCVCVSPNGCIHQQNPFSSNGSQSEKRS